ncbi:MAG: hypothetical protein HZA11_03995 [Nitrospirae bacterium]|nr:hypothetical protein [Nitrospirota bacterium]
MKTLLSGLTGLALFFCIFLQASAHENHSEGKKLFTKHFHETLFEITGTAAFSIEVLPDEKEYKIGENVAGIVVHDDNDADVEGAKLIITHKNLETGETAPGAISVKERGEGLYIVSGLDLKREGRWELAIAVKKNKIEDRVKFILPDALKKPHPKGKYSP